MRAKRPQYAFFGAAPDTTNRGVSALFRCVVEGIGNALPESRLLAFDNGTGARSAKIDLEAGANFEYERMGARGGRRYYAPENLATMSALSFLGSRATRWHRVLAELRRSDAVLDISGGDSFSDIYGAERFWNTVRPKLIAKRLGLPLVLLPQTYGPFEDAALRRVAKDAVQAASAVWARDPQSYRALQSLLGDAFDPKRHREGVDVAFNLRPKEPTDIEPILRQWIAERASHPLIGLNVSGLVALDPEEARRRYDLRADYPGALTAFIQSVMSAEKVRVVLIPHVMAPPGSYESDVEACRRVLGSLPETLRGRVRVTSTDFDEREVKWLISNLDWFCGMRMHSTIAGLSSRVPTSAVAYSDKTRGVFETCDVGDQVLDPRRLDTHELSERLEACWNARAETAALISTSIDRVKARATQQFADVVAILKQGVLDRSIAEQPHA